MDDTWQAELDDLLGLDEGLTDWEMEFVDSINSQVNRGFEPSDKCIEKIHEIWDRVS